MSRDGAARVHHLTELGRWGEAQTLLAPLLAADPDDADLHELQAAVCDGLGDGHGVIASAGRAAALAPDREAPHRLMAYAHRALGDHEAAHRSAREAQRLGPSHWATHVTVAMMASMLPGRADEATAAADRGLELAPMVSTTHFAAGFAAQGRGRRREASQHYRRALAIDPQHPESLNNLTMVTSRGRPDRALRGYAAALRLDPHCPVSLANLQTTAVRAVVLVAAIGFMAVGVGELLTAFGTRPVGAASRVVGAAIAIAAAGFIAVFVSGCSRPVRMALRLQWRARPDMWAGICGVLALLGFGLALCWVSGFSHRVGRHALIVWLPPSMMMLRYMSDRLSRYSRPG